MDKKCSNCFWFKVYYTKEVYNFLRKTNGFCENRRNVCESKDYCEDWKRREYEYQKHRRTTALNYLCDAALDLIKMQQIVGEYQKDIDNENPS